MKNACRLFTTAVAIFALVVSSKMAYSQQRARNTVSFRDDLWAGVAIKSQRHRTVSFYTTATDALTDQCLKQNSNGINRFFAATSFMFSLGEKCGDLFIIIHQARGGKLSDQAREFVGDHESFHLIAQIFAGPTPSILVFGPRPEYTDGSIVFFEYIENALSQSNNMSLATIAEISKRYFLLSPQDRYVVDYYATVEWPAEYYAFKKMSSELPGWSYQSYRAIRREIADEAAYRVAIPVGLTLDRMLGVNKWEGRIFTGSSMLTILAGIYSADGLSEVSLLHVEHFELNLPNE